MLLIFLIFALAASVNCKPQDKAPEPEWPDKYFYEISKYNLGAGLLENIRIWRTSTQSRLEYNNGAVIEIVTSRKTKSRGYRYEIHPETSGKDDQNKMVCNVTTRSLFDEGPANILPDIDEFKLIGPEKLRGRDAYKYKSENAYENIDEKRFLWTYYDQQLKSWIILRYETEAFNSKLGNLEERQVWEFDSFSNDFNNKEVFSAKKICNEDDPIRKYLKKNESISHVMFIDPDNEKHVNLVFKAFKNKYSRNYKDDHEHTTRRTIFQEKLRLIKSTNSKNLGYKLTVNKFADRTPKELKHYMGLLPRPKGKIGTHPFPYEAEQLQAEAKKVPPSFDLRIEGVISPVQTQDTCGSCWTFGTTSALEGALARINGGTVMSLSNQALIDCAWEFGAKGCGGGSDNAAYEWMIKYGMPTVAEYGLYTNKNGFCHIQNVTRTYKIRGFVDVTPNSVEALKVALVNHGPLSVSVHADSWFSYDGGVFYDFDCSSQDLDHEVTLVGYGEQYGETFWILKNSWGPDWGIDGYMHIAAKDNNCGVMTEPTFVIVD